MTHKAFTLLELLIAHAIIALLVALLFPVLAAARRKAHEVPCASNLHQFHVAWSMYVDDSAGTYPLNMALIYPYVRNKGVFSCPMAAFGGVSPISRRLGTPVSYFYLLSDDVNSFANIDVLRQRDPNHGVFYCVLHGKPCPTPLKGSAKTLSRGGFCGLEWMVLSSRVGLDIGAFASHVANMPSFAPSGSL